MPDAPCSLGFVQNTRCFRRPSRRRFSFSYLSFSFSLHIFQTRKQIPNFLLHSLPGGSSNGTLSRQGAPRLNGPALAHFSVAVARISSASPSLRRLELNQSRLRSGHRVFTIRVPNRTRRGPAGIAVPMSRGRNNVLWGHGQ